MGCYVKYKISGRIGTGKFLGHVKEMKLRVLSYFHSSFRKVILGQVNVNDCPAGLELPTAARNRRKATLKIGQNSQI